MTTSPENELFWLYCRRSRNTNVIIIHPPEINSMAAKLVKIQTDSESSAMKEGQTGHSLYKTTNVTKTALSETPAIQRNDETATPVKQTCLPAHLDDVDVSCSSVVALIIHWSTMAVFM